MAALPIGKGHRRAAVAGGITAQSAPAAFWSHAKGALAMIAAALEQSQPGMFTALSAREDALLVLFGVLATLPGCWRQAACGGAG